MLWLLLYFAALAFSACFHSGKGGNEHYFVYGRKAASGLVCFSLLASCIGGSATIGMLGLAYEVGFPAFWWLGSGAFGLLALGFFLAAKVRQSNAWTMPQIVEKSLGSSFRKIAAIIIFLAYIAIMAAQFNALQTIIANLAELSPEISLAAGIGITLFYTMLGGQAAIMRSDVWQFAIMAALLAALVAFCLANPASRADLASMSWIPFNEKFPPMRMIYYLFILGGSFVVGPMLFGRVLSAKDEKSARRGVFYAAFGLFFIALAITCAGVCMRAWQMPEEIAQQEIFGFFTRTYLPAWANVPALLGMLSVILSSADSCLFTVATVCANDLFKRPTIATCRLFMILVCGLSWLLALQGKGILKLLLMANDVYVCGLAVPVFVAMLAGKKFAINRAIMLLAMICGGGIGFCAALASLEWLSLTALALSIVFALLALKLPGKNLPA